MPGLNGIELLEEIKEVYRNEPYVGILCTAYGTMHLFKEEFRQNLFSFFIEKPFDGNCFCETVQEAVIRLGKQ